MMIDALTADIARQLLRYDPWTGKLFWRHRERKWFKSDGSWKRWNSLHAGQEALAALDKDGYLRGRMLGKTYRAHRIAWLIETGRWPENEIDHLNGFRNDNRIKNLRDVTHSENGKNQKLSAVNTSGASGVHWDKRQRKWRARIEVSGTRRCLGLFDDLSEAVKARDAAAAEYGFHPNHGDRYE